MTTIFNKSFDWRTAVFICLLVVGLGDESAAQESKEASVDEVEETEEIEEIEEIVVVGDKSLVTLRHAVYRAEERFFAVFNEKNSDDEFDIHCRYVAATGTRIRRHRCEANFLRTAATRRALRWAGSGSRSDGVVTPYARVEKKLKQLEEEMKALVVSDPRLLAAALEYENAKKTYKEERERRCSDKVLICN